MHVVLKIAAALLAAYILLSAGFLAIMLLPPESFAKAVSRTPGPLMMVLPFRPLWFIARGGHLKVGDEAPDFSLPALDKKSTVRLSAFRGQKPVVLVFGSYT